MMYLREEYGYLLSLSFSSMTCLPDYTHESMQHYMQITYFCRVRRSMQKQQLIACSLPLTILHFGLEAGAWQSTKTSQLPLLSHSPQSRTQSCLTLADTPVQFYSEQTYLEVSFDKRQKWKPQLENAEAKTNRKCVTRRKLTGTKCGADESILKRVYQRALQHLEYGSTTRSITAKSHQQKPTYVFVF